MNYKKPDGDKNSKDTGNLVIEKYSEIHSDSLMDMRELAVEWANSVQAYLKMDSVLLPPGGIFDHLGMLLVVAEFNLSNLSLDCFVVFYYLFACWLWLVCFKTERLIC